MPLSAPHPLLRARSRAGRLRWTAVASTLIGLSLCLLVLWEGGLFAGQTWAWHHMAWVLVLQAITLLVVYALLRGARYSESIADWVDQVEWQNLQHLRAIQQRDDIEKAVLEATPVAIVVCDTDGRVRLANPACQSLLDWTVQDEGHLHEILRPHGPEGGDLGETLHGEAYLSWVMAHVPAGAEGLQHRSTGIHWWVQRRTGGVTPVAVCASHLGQAGASHGAVLVMADLSERLRSEAHLQHVAQHDSMTGLPNRQYMEQQLQQALRMGSRQGSAVGLLFVDLDRFKYINDSLGHHMGDLVICEAANRIRQLVRKSDVVARMSGDEFVVLLPDLKREEGAVEVARKIVDALNAPMRVLDQVLHVSASVGVATSPQHGDDAAQLMKRADAAMFEAKEAGRNAWRLFSGMEDPKAAERLKLKAALQVALEQGEIMLYYQPQHDCATGRLVGAEALMRWKHGERMIPPDQFIPLAEDCGLIVPLGAWALEQACQDAHQWWQHCRTAIRVSVNLSPRQMEHVDVFGQIHHALERTKLPSALLEVEITEGCLVRDLHKTASTLHRVRSLGVSVAIDDFGVGYSSLAYLQELPFDTIKVDRSFLSKLKGQPGGRGWDGRLVSAIIAIGHSLRVDVVAEGVETEAQLNFLKEQQCQKAQGYFLGRPMPMADFLAYIERHWPAGQPTQTVA